MTKKNAKKRAARALKEAHGGSYQHHLRHVGGADGRPNDGAMTATAAQSGPSPSPAASNDLLGEFHSRAMMEHVLRRSVALLFHSPDDRVIGIGSGTCVEIAGRYFVATCAHNVTGVASLREIGVIPLQKAGLTGTQTPRLIGSGSRGGGDYDAVDIGWLEIEPRAIPRMVSEWDRIFVTLDRFRLAPVQTDSPAYVFGAPWEYKQDSEVGGLPFHRIGALPYLTRTVDVKDGRAPERSLFVEYKGEMKTAEGTKPLPNAHGLSGSGLWVVNPQRAAIWTPDLAQFAAIQHAWARGEHLSGTLVREWLQMLREDIPDVSSAIDPLLDGGRYAPTG